MVNRLIRYYEDLRVAVHQGEHEYNDIPPFDAGRMYPEYDHDFGISRVVNPAYEGVRRCFGLLGLDRRCFSRRQWNPLGEIVKPGNRVVVKPNFVLSRHCDGGNLYAIITHPSVIRVIVDYVYKALKGEGEITIADAPQMDCNFDELLTITRLPSIQELYWRKKKFDIKILDLRDFWLDKHADDAGAFTERRRKLPGDPLGSVTINLGRDSELHCVRNWDRFYGADYNRGETIRHHRGEIQEYMISRTVLEADVVISAPKLKVHKKVGVTLNAKGLVGIATNKNYLVHYRLGTPEVGGDQLPSRTLTHREMLLVRIQRFLYDALLAKRRRFYDKLYAITLSSYRKCIKPFVTRVSKARLVLDDGNWYGNDSAWRMVVDLMKIIIYADTVGNLKSTPQRKVFSVIDGLIGGDNNGPLAPDERKAGLLLAGFNPVAVDVVGTRTIGFDYKKLKLFSRLINNTDCDFFVKDVFDIKICSDRRAYRRLFYTKSGMPQFTPHRGWQGHVEHA